MNGGADFALVDGAIHVWSFALDLPREHAARLYAYLAPDERGRAAAFHFERDRAHFVAARGALRELLGRYLRIPAAEVAFTTGRYGKPHLASVSGSGDLRFNLSHSHGHALLAVTQGCDVGVDLERIREEVDVAEIVSGHFSRAEQAAWRGMPAAERVEAFFNGWVRKEAYVKARGEGFSHEARRYTVDLQTAAGSLLLADELDAAAPQKWQVYSLPNVPGFASAIAYSGPVRPIVFQTR